jgi:nitrogen regulatory protein PII
MAQRNRAMTVLTDLTLITCIVQRGAANDIVRAAVASGAQGATVHYATGSGLRERLGLIGMAIEVDKEVVNIVVANEQADHIFEVMFRAGHLDTPGMGFIYMTALEKAATYIPESVRAKLATRGAGT